MCPHASTAVEQLYEAVLVLASEEGKIQERVARAYSRYLRTLDVSVFPDKLRNECEIIRAELKRLCADDGAHDGIDKVYAAELAQRIIMVYDALLR